MACFRFIRKGVLISCDQYELTKATEFRTDYKSTSYTLLTDLLKLLITIYFMDIYVSEKGVFLGTATLRFDLNSI